MLFNMKTKQTYPIEISRNNFYEYWDNITILTIVNNNITDSWRKQKNFQIPVKNKILKSDVRIVQISCHNLIWEPYIPFNTQKGIFFIFLHNILTFTVLTNVQRFVTATQFVTKNPLHMCTAYCTAIIYQIKLFQ